MVGSKLVLEDVLLTVHSCCMCSVCAGDGDGDEAFGAVGAVAGAEDEDDDWGLEEDDEKA